jgi:hypothetical protein
VTSAHDDVEGFLQNHTAYGRPMSMRVRPGGVLASVATIVGILICVLVDETLVLVERHHPGIDIASGRERMKQRRPAWWAR